MSSFAMEWHKLQPLHRTSRTVAWSIALAVAVSAAVSAALAPNAAHLASLGRFDPVAVSLEGVNAAVLVIAAFGVLGVTREYSTGMIATTFLAQPRRLRVLAAKLGTHSAVAAVAGVAACVTAFAVGQALLSTARMSVGWGAAHVPSALAGGALYLVLICVWGVALGALLRSSSTAITWLASLLVVAPVIVQIMPESVVHVIGRWLPSQIGMRAIASDSDPHSFAPWTGLGVLALYVGVTLLAGAWRMTRHDP